MIKNEKGVTLLALTITVIVMVIITGTLIYNANNQLHIKKIDNLYSDIEQIKDKVSQYYIKYGKLPVKGRYCTANELVEILKQNGANSVKTQEDLLDINDKKSPTELTYYVIDLSKLDNLTLYYGSKFKDWTPNVEVNAQTGEEIYSSSTTEQDLYIINEKSQQIYYPKGITVENSFYYVHGIDLNAGNSAELEVTNISGITVSKITVSDISQDGKVHVAKDSKNSIKASFDIKVPNSNEVSNVYYALKEKTNTDEDIKSPQKFENCNGLTIDNNDEDEDNKTYHVNILSPKMRADTYYLWIRIIDVNGNETLTKKSINQQEQLLNGIDNEISIVEEQIELTIENIERQAEVSIKYNPEILEDISYGEGEFLEDARQNVNKINTNIEYETDENGNRIYTLVVTENEYVFVTARDGFGNNTSAYVEVQLDMLKPSSTVNAETSFSTSKGTIDIIWLQGATNIPSNPQVANTPKVVDGMAPVTWSLSGTSWIEDEETKSTWYNYNITAKQWANVTDTNGSYFVWIPRFAYRITYYDENDATNSTPTGYYDGFGLWNAETKEVKYSFSNEITEITYKSKSYIVHNAFLSDADNGGGFGTNNVTTGENGITGFWVAKYEMSQQKSIDSGSSWSDVSTSSSSDGNVAIANTGTNRIRAISLPNKTKWRYINIANCYTNSKNYGAQTFNSGVTVNSHLMKNSEWGAVAYLAHSQYGLNGTNIAINNSSTYTTGKSAGTSDASSSDTNYDYNEKTNGIKASSTGNIYGIYDLSGGALEYVAAFNKNYSAGSTNYFTDSDYIDTNGNHFASVGGTSDAYATAYSNSTTTYSGTTIYSVGITGDATKEVYNGSGSDNWFSDYSYFVHSDNPFFSRGGSYRIKANAGLFNSNARNGGVDSYGRFPCGLGSLAL